jgi:NAD(P)-dependent dehydrogenase (short-subunit alcohol dehydrogenase family)
VRAAALDRQHGTRALAQALPEQRMGQIRARLIEPGQAETPRGGAHPEALKLRKDEPHPVARLAAYGELLEYTPVAALLCLEEAPEVVGPVAHGSGGLCARRKATEL